MQLASFIPRKYILSCLAMLMPLCLYSNTFKNNNLTFINYTIEDGLTENTVHTIFQDSFGYLWFGTGNGVCRFDGYSITEINIQKDSRYRKVRNIYSFYENNKNDILIGTDNGLFKYERESENISLLAGPDTMENLLPISNYAVKTILGDDEGNLWIGTFNGLYKINKNGEIKSYLFTQDPSLEPILITDLIFNEKNQLYIGTNLGLMLMDTGSETIDHYPHYTDNEINSTTQKNATSLEKGNNNLLYIGTWGMGMYVFDMTTKKYVKSYTTKSDNQNSLSGNVIFALNLDHEGNLWIGTENNGLNKLDIRTDVFSIFKNTDYQTNSLSGNTIKSIATDNHGDLWLGTYSGGISKLDFNKMKFNHYQHYYSISNSLSNNKITSFLEIDTDDIWIGTDGGGINRFNPYTGEFRHYRVEENNIQSISSDFIMSLNHINNQIWAGTYNSGINILNKNGVKVQTLKMDLKDSLSLSGNNIASVYKDSKERIWVGVTYNLPCLYLGNGKFIQIKHPENANISIRSVRDFHEDKNGNMWFGGNGDLVKLDSFSAGQFYFSKTDLFIQSNGLVRPSITSIDEDKSGNLLIGTQGFGLAVFNPALNKTNILTENEGLPSNDILGITMANDSTSWVSTSKGLVNLDTRKIFSKDTILMHAYDAKDGLQGNTFNIGAIICTTTGLVFAGGNNGFNAFYPGSLLKNTQPSPIYIVGLEINHQSIDKDSRILQGKSPHVIDNIELKHNQSTVTVYFTAVDHKSSVKIQYRYRLIGFEESWNKAGIERKATYTNLDPGTYHLKIQASNSSGIWNEKGVSLTIKIFPPWWQTWWAALLYIFVVSVTVLLFRRFLIIKERKRNLLDMEKMEISKEKELSKLKLQFFTNISHELRTPLSLIGGPIDQLLESGNYNQSQKIQLDLVQRNTKRLKQLVDQLMDFRKLESQTLPFNPTTDDLIALLKMIFNDFEHLALNKQIHYNFISNKNEYYTFYDVDKMQKIVYNLISNAFKFTRSKGKISVIVDINEPEKKVYIKVADTGIGIAKEHLKHIFDPFYQAHAEYYNKQKGTGIGLTLCKALVEIHKGELMVESNKAGLNKDGYNTIFTIMFPILKPVTNDQEQILSKDISLADVKVQQNHNEGPITEELDSEPEQNNKKPNILLVEDNVDLKTFITINLGELYNFYSAENGIEGLEKAKKILPDLIISDIIMPEMDGIEMCEKLKTMPETSHIPVIILTAKTSEESTVEGLQTGIDTYLTKPFSIKVLASYIKNILKNRSELYEKYRSSYHLDDLKICSTKTDEEFILKVQKTLNNNLSDFSFGVDELSKEVGMSRTNFYKKIRSLTGFTVNDFIKNYKLKVAANLLIESDLNINEVAYEIGLKDASYFSRCFKQTFGCLPSEFSKNKNLNNRNKVPE